jgi:hypothetical protein
MEFWQAGKDARKRSNTLSDIAEAVGVTAMTVSQSSRRGIRERHHVKESIEGRQRSKFPTQRLSSKFETAVYRTVGLVLAIFRILFY